MRNTKNLKIIKVLLDSPDGTLTKYKLAKISNTSIPWTIQFLKKLEIEGIVEKTKVIDFDKLIDYYIKIDKKYEKYYFHISNPLDFFKETNLDYALTTYAAENIINHHLFPNKFHVYIAKEDYVKWKKLILTNGLIGNGNVILIISKDKDVFKEAKKIKDIKVVSIPQLLIDLKKEGGVCIEAYNILLDRYVQQKRN
jgi:energy-converting hydrogenase Eha subunit H